MKFILQTIANTAALGVLLLILTIPVTTSLWIVSSKDQAEDQLAFEVKPPQLDYGEFLSYGQVAGGQAESLSLQYTAFPEFTAYYEVYVVKNTYRVPQKFKVELSEKRNDVRLFFARPGQESGLSEQVLAPGEKAVITLAVEPVKSGSVQTGTVSFIIQSLPFP